MSLKIKEAQSPLDLLVHASHTVENRKTIKCPNLVHAITYMEAVIYKEGANKGSLTSVGALRVHPRCSGTIAVVCLNLFTLTTAILSNFFNL
jgi:hypothetical protein